MPLVLAPLLISGLVFFAAVVLVALNHAFNAWFGSATQGGNSGGLQGAVISILTAPLRAIGGTAHKIARSTVSHWALAHVKPLAAWFTALHSLAHNTYAELGRIASDTAAAVEHLVAVTIPREVARGNAKAQQLARQGVRTAEHALARTRAIESEIARLRTSLLARVHALTHAIDVTIPGELGRIRAREKALEDSIPHALKARLGKVEAFVFGGAIVGLLIRTLARRFPWLFCRNTQNLGKRVCGLDASLLESLLADTLLIAGTLSLVEFAKEMQTVEAGAVRLVQDFWRVG